MKNLDTNRTAVYQPKAPVDRRKVAIRKTMAFKGLKLECYLVGTFRKNGKTLKAWTPVRNAMSAWVAIEVPNRRNKLYAYTCGNHQASLAWWRINKPSFSNV